MLVIAMVAFVALVVGFALGIAAANHTWID